MVKLFEQEYATEAYAWNVAAKAAKKAAEEAEKQGKLEVLWSLVRDGILMKDEAAKRVNMTVEEFDEECKGFVS